MLKIQCLSIVKLFDCDIILFTLIKRSPEEMVKLAHCFYFLNILILQQNSGVRSQE
ncbi:hypothetical protein [Trichormus sp. NMC-1]|uniref:hypothetical protein n=1 Tax=Trichormus sp. NMC-1 TaxID=1853259 RepID=UPI0015A69F76|nr:hypothetical protein [Trichormus sp. NMC-1]